MQLYPRFIGVRVTHPHALEPLWVEARKGRGLELGHQLALLRLAWRVLLGKADDAGRVPLLEAQAVDGLHQQRRVARQ